MTANSRNRGYSAHQGLPLLPRWNVALTHVLLLDVIHHLREAVQTGLRQLPVDALQAIIVKRRQVLSRSITIIFQRIS